MSLHVHLPYLDEGSKPWLLSCSTKETSEGIKAKNKLTMLQARSSTFMDIRLGLYSKIASAILSHARRYSGGIRRGQSDPWQGVNTSDLAISLPSRGKEQLMHKREHKELGRKDEPTTIHQRWQAAKAQVGGEHQEACKKVTVCSSDNYHTNLSLRP